MSSAQGCAVHGPLVASGGAHGGPRPGCQGSGWETISGPIGLLVREPDLDGAQTLSSGTTGIWGGGPRVARGCTVPGVTRMGTRFWLRGGSPASARAAGSPVEGCPEWYRSARPGHIRQVLCSLSHHITSVIASLLPGSLLNRGPWDPRRSRLPVTAASTQSRITVSRVHGTYMHHTWCTCAHYMRADRWPRWPHQPPGAKRVLVSDQHVCCCEPQLSGLSVSDFSGLGSLF